MAFLWLLNGGDPNHLGPSWDAKQVVVSNILYLHSEESV